MKAKYCIKCGKPIKETNLFCSFCGEKAAEFTFEKEQETGNVAQGTVVLDDTYSEKTESLGNFKIPDFSTNIQPEPADSTAIKEHCPYCGAKISADDEFCMECGNRIIRDFKTDQDEDSIETTVLNPIKMGAASNTFVLSDRMPGAKPKAVTFCLSCGCRVPADCDYCPECGRKVER